MKYSYWSWTNVFSFNKIKKINNYIDNNFNFYENSSLAATDGRKKNKKNVLVKCITYSKVEKYLKSIVDFAYSINKKHFGYDLYPNLYDTCLNLNIYSADKLQEYDWHVDATSNPYEDIKFTILINLSMTPYEGGKFYIFNQNEEEVIELNTPGNVIMFKSFINHKVSPVISGERRTLAIFLSGPNFK
jgi:PKHD-type hydroxylase